MPTPSAPTRHNFFDHNNIGESNLFFPLTIQNALIRGWEVTLRSPRIAHRGQIHVAYSNQVALGRRTPSTAASPIFPSLPTGDRSITTSATRSTSAAT